MGIFEGPINKFNQFRSRKRVNDPLKAEVMAKAGDKDRSNVGALKRGDPNAERILSWREYASMADISEELAEELYDKVKKETDKVDDSQLKEAVSSTTKENDLIQDRELALEKEKTDVQSTLYSPEEESTMAKEEFEEFFMKKSSLVGEKLAAIRKEEDEIYKKKQELAMKLFILSARLTKIQNPQE